MIQSAQLLIDEANRHTTAMSCLEAHFLETPDMTAGCQSDLGKSH